ncbi:DUF1684 domain-containing protein [Sinomicrobium soli]|uniref:DUF1684 domain-containing protein n=1 Tax=Sinomicrobium sp. N-1-3-6 TaxID=2219864 RepID=UPI000DCC10E8|nr:DUF1684 domain-containing protein [Sinomicrobium sp. N-1-3-6]RAV29856.1 DUF1684 domain-containing protein [Sinomicrobium sp. N-1-3-6]
MKKQYLIMVFLLVLAGCKGDRRYHDIGTTATQDSTDVLWDIAQFQKTLNGEFRDPGHSPLKERDRKDFRGLDFFPADTLLRVVARLERTPGASPFAMATTTSRSVTGVRYGILHFTIEGEEYRLNVYQNPEVTSRPGYADYLFLPFADATNGEETYGGGRYIDLRIPEGNEIVLDFNKAYNPYCAYNPSYSCPVVPDENTLAVPIRAGVKAFSPGK